MGPRLTKVLDVLHLPNAVIGSWANKDSTSSTLRQNTRASPYYENRLILITRNSWVRSTSGKWTLPKLLTIIHNRAPPNHLPTIYPEQDEIIFEHLKAAFTVGLPKTFQHWLFFVAQWARSLETELIALSSLMKEAKARANPFEEWCHRQIGLWPGNHDRKHNQIQNKKYK